MAGALFAFVGWKSHLGAKPPEVSGLTPSQQTGHGGMRATGDAVGDGAAYQVDGASAHLSMGVAETGPS